MRRAKNGAQLGELFPAQSFLYCKWKQKQNVRGFQYPGLVILPRVNTKSRKPKGPVAETISAAGLIRAIPGVKSHLERFRQPNETDKYRKPEMASITVVVGRYAKEAKKPKIRNQELLQQRKVLHQNVLL